MNNVSQAMFTDGMRIANEANGVNGGGPEEPKTLEMGCAYAFGRGAGDGVGGVCFLCFFFFLSISIS